MIPPELSKLASLIDLRLDRNRLAGRLPRALRGLRLEFLVLDPPVGDVSPEHQRLVTESTARLGDEIAGMIAAGESKTVEFKSTLRVNLKTGKRDKRIEHAALKNIAAFLNTDGGTLFIGVGDDGNPLGLDNDDFPNEDEMALYLSDIVNDQIGAGAFGSIDPEFTSYLGKRILVIRCMKSAALVFVGKDKDFYVRTGPGARRLNPLEFKDFLEGHFP